MMYVTKMIGEQKWVLCYSTEAADLKDLCLRPITEHGRPKLTIMFYEESSAAQAAQSVGLTGYTIQSIGA